MVTVELIMYMLTFNNIEYCIVKCGKCQLMCELMNYVFVR